jgi:TATA-box binding protein (TBP) (component of TFIID and TFIIIB)
MEFRSPKSDFTTNSNSSVGKEEEISSGPFVGTFIPTSKHSEFYDIRRSFEGVWLHIDNVTTNYRLCQMTPLGPIPIRLDLDKIANTERSVFGWSYNPKKSMPALKLNIQSWPYVSKLNVALYSTGSVVQTGCQTPEQAQLAAHLFARRMLRLLGIHVVVADFKVDNMVATFQLDHTYVNLQVLKMHIGARCEYVDPNAPTNLKTGYAPAIIQSTVNKKNPVNLNGENIKVLMYDTGRGVMMGVRSRSSFTKVTAEIIHDVDESKKFEGAIVQGVTMDTWTKKIEAANAAYRTRIEKK